jgi:hypothetical protein
MQPSILPQQIEDIDIGSSSAKTFGGVEDVNSTFLWYCTDHSIVSYMQGAGGSVYMLASADHPVALNKSSSV